MADDVTSYVSDDGNFVDGNDKTYTVYAIQATVGKEHEMEFNKVAQFLQGIEKEVNQIGGESNGKEILKNSLLGGKVSVQLLYLEPLVQDTFDAPGQNEVKIPQETWGQNRDAKVRRALLMKLKVMYGVVNPYEGSVQWCEEEKQEEKLCEEEEEEEEGCEEEKGEEDKMDCDWYVKLCEIYTVIIFWIKVAYVDIWTRIGYFRRGW